MASFLITANGKFTRRGRAELDALFSRLAAQEEPRLLLHVHGGLVDQPTARSNAVRLDGADAYGPLLDAGWETTYLIWQTGVFEALRNNLGELADDKLFNRLVQRLLKWVGERVLDSSSSRGEITDGEVREEMAVPGEPFSDRATRDPAEIERKLTEDERARAEAEAAPPEPDDLYRMLDDDVELQAIGRRIEREIEREQEPLASRAGADPEAARSWANLDSRIRAESLRWGTAEADPSRGFGTILPAVLFGAARAGYRSIKRFLKQRDHGLYCTIVEELAREVYGDRIGSHIWGLMQGDARDHFRTGGAGALLLERLATLAGTKEEMRLLIVGHSAGSILASHLVVGASRLPDNIRLDLVFLAPAVRMDEAARTIAAAGARLANLRIFTMEDSIECQDDLDNTIAGKVYPRSLLYLISGILERRRGGAAYADAPLLGMDRHLRLLPAHRLEDEEREACGIITRFLDGAPNRIIYSVAEGQDGLCTRAKTHGTFDNDADTLKSIRRIAREGGRARLRAARRQQRLWQ